MAVFVDIKTAWIIGRLGHGHNDLIKVKDLQIILKKDKKSITASAKFYQYTEITDTNPDSFEMTAI
ncbi:MAG: hypothetical protein MRK01_09660 [Candidatus Scalindua sp.]|nr:hypothetical protein [Candidatus Scalindua sp.]